MQTPWSITVQDAGRSPLNAWLLEQITERVGVFHWDVVRTRDILAAARFAQASGELDSRRLNNQNLGRAMTEIGVRRWATSREHWQIVRNAATAREKGRAETPGSDRNGIRCRTKRRSARC